eukprot:scaffold605_cov43-Phaeocystis_antarctica.AAC.1
MYGMFYVRPSPCSAPNLQSSPLPCALLAPRSPRDHPSPPATRAAPRPSSLTTMYSMFYVRSSPCPVPICSRARPCTLREPRSPAASRPNLAPHRMPSFRLSAVRVGVQPAAELRHHQRHEHVRHVPGALLPVPCPKSAVEPCPARCLPRDRPPPPVCWPAPSPRTACPPFDSRQSASAFNQPLSFDTSSVTSMGLMFSVRSSPCPAPNLQSHSPLHAACAAVVHRLLPPDPYTSPRTACPPIDSAGHTLPVQRQQAAHPLRVGGHLGLSLCWLWLELGSGKLLAKLSPR